MQDLIKNINSEAKVMNADSSAVSELYDKYAPALYGRILMVIKQKEIADKVLERVFINAFVDKNIQQSNHISFFTSLINHSRKKSHGTIKALKVLQQCCGTQATMTQ